mgnify:CR=1 FL=1
MEKQVLLSLDQELKRVLLRSLEAYRQELIRSDRKVNKPLYHEIIRQELILVNRLSTEIERKWSKAMGLDG